LKKIYLKSFCILLILFSSCAERAVEEFDSNYKTSAETNIIWIRHDNSNSTDYHFFACLLIFDDSSSSYSVGSVDSAERIEDGIIFWKNAGARSIYGVFSDEIKIGGEFMGVDSPLFSKTSDPMPSECNSPI
jgi:hypothetical protein